MTVRIGVSGWSYDSWRGDFYPPGLARARQLEFIGERFSTVEVNGSFYSLLSPRTYRRYRDQTPADFRFAVKGSRFITHNKKLGDIHRPLANFFASGLLALGAKLDVVLWQLPERHAIRPERLQAFLDLLPRDLAAGAELARDHDDRIVDAVTTVHSNHRIRHALEIRNPGDLNADTVRLLREEGLALVFSHAGGWSYTEELTAGFVYLRLHGSPETYASGYGDEDLAAWAERIRRWKDGGQPDDPHRITDRMPPRRKHRDVYVYFDNDARGHAPHDAGRLMERLGR